jgi:hypothetical protein
MSKGFFLQILGDEKCDKPALNSTASAIVPVVQHDIMMLSQMAM